jgi:hypothetical protein
MILRRSGSRASAFALLATRLFPAAASLLLSVVLFVPAHWATEARDLNESFGWGVYIFALAGAFLIVRGVARAFALGSADRCLRVTERRSPVVPDATESAHVRGLALAGLVRTRILLDPRVAASLTPAELDVAIAHEVAHRRAFDNLKRGAFYCAPDFIGSSRMATYVERAWHAAAESLADARAARADEQRAADLASALIKVARLTGCRSTSVSPVWSTFNDPTLLKQRVYQLTSDVPVAAPYRSVRAFSLALGVLAATAMLVPVLSATIHRVTEAAVAFLP